MQEKSWEINLNRTNNQIEHIEGPYGYGVNIIEVSIRYKILTTN